MLKVIGVMTLQKVINETKQAQNGKSFQVVELQGYVETGWTFEGAKPSLPVMVKPNKKAIESLGEISMLQAGSKIEIEGYVKGRLYNDKVYTDIVATKCNVSNMGMHYQQPQQMQQPVTSANDLPEIQQGIDYIPF